MEIKLPCRNCGGHIEFDAQDAGQSVPCPHCGSTIILSVPPEPLPNVATCPDCKSLVSKAAISCPKCGRPVKKPRNLPLIFGCAIFAGALGLAAILLHGRGRGDDVHNAKPVVDQRPEASTNAPADASVVSPQRNPMPAPVAPPMKEPSETKMFPHLTEAEIASARQIIGALKITRDAVEGITWYQLETGYDTSVFLYVGVFPSGDRVLRFKMRYYGEHWLFVKTLLVRVDDELVTIEPTKEMDRKSGSGHVWEIFDEPADDNIDTIVKMIKSRNCILRFKGEDSSEDYDVNYASKANMARMILIYRYLGGNFEKK